MSLLVARENVAEVVDLCLRRALEPSTRDSYIAALEQVAGDGAKELVGIRFLSLNSALRLMALFNELDVQPWGAIASVWTWYVRTWHVESSSLDVCNQAWPERACLF